MKTSLSFKLAFRFLNSKRYGALAKFISMASTTGIGVGVCALIIGLSAMNGFEYELNNRVLSLIPGAEVSSYDKTGFYNLEGEVKALEKAPNIKAVSPAVSLNGAFSFGANFAPAMVIGIDPVNEKKVIDLERFMDCKTDILNEAEAEPLVIIGHGIAKKLNIKKGDELNLSAIDAKTNSDGLGSMVVKTFKVAGFFKTGGQIDNNFAFINIKEAVALSALRAPNTIHVKVSNMLEAREIINTALATLPEPCDGTTWIDSQGKLYSDINMIRQIMYLAMILVISVACFNIVSNLVMAVSEKRHEIAILMTMGAKKALIIKSFTLMGVFSAIKGCIYGGVTGSLLSLCIPYVTSHFKDWFGIELLNEDIYFINFVPSRLMISDVLIVVGCAIVMSFIASIYPAIKASKIDPAQELNL
ncbi:MAG: ABC transporter permease [Succinivibrio sp.]|nr:ABC transporter permease [Succinivibrio sp.]